MLTQMVVYLAQMMGILGFKLRQGGVQVRVIYLRPREVHAMGFTAGVDKSGSRSVTDGDNLQPFFMIG